MGYAVTWGKWQSKRYVDVQQDGKDQLAIRLWSLSEIVTFLQALQLVMDVQLDNATKSNHVIGVLFEGERGFEVTLTPQQFKVSQCQFSFKSDDGTLVPYSGHIYRPSHYYGRKMYVAFPNTVQGQREAVMLKRRLLNTLTAEMKSLEAAIEVQQGRFTELLLSGRLLYNNANPWPNGHVVQASHLRVLPSPLPELIASTLQGADDPMTPEDVAQDMNLDRNAVKSILKLSIRYDPRLTALRYVLTRTRAANGLVRYAANRIPRALFEEDATLTRVLLEDAPKLDVLEPDAPAKHRKVTFGADHLALDRRRSLYLSEKGVEAAQFWSGNNLNKMPSQRLAALTIRLFDLRRHFENDDTEDVEEVKNRIETAVRSHLSTVKVWRDNQ